MVEKLDITKKIDSLGRVLIPQSLRSRFKIAAGDELEIVLVDDWIAMRKKGSATGTEIAEAIELLENNGFKVVRTEEKQG